MDDNSDWDRTAFLRHIQDQIVPIDASDPLSDLSDLEPLRHTFGNATVIALGEVTHGTKEFFELKHRLVRFLVEELGLRVFALEASFSEAFAVDAYVFRGKGDPKEALNGLQFWTKNTKEVLGLITWLREFNAARPPGDRVRFYGVDIQYSQRSADAVMSYLVTVDPDYVETVRADLAVLVDPGLQRTVEEGRDERIAIAERVVPDIKATLEEEQENYISESSETEWEVTRQHTRILKRATDFTGLFHDAGGSHTVELLRKRDRAMAENVSWILNYESANRIVLWAHNTHISTTPMELNGSSVSTMGDHLRQQYGQDYYALAFEFSQGAFQALGDPDDTIDHDELILQEHRLENPVPGTVGAAFEPLELSLGFLDFEAAENDPHLADWLHTEQQLHTIGGVFDPDHPEAYVKSHVLSDAFDGLLYVEKSTRAHPLNYD